MVKNENSFTLKRKQICEWWKKNFKADSGIAKSRYLAQCAFELNSTIPTVTKALEEQNLYP